MSGNPMKRLSSFPAGKATMEDTWESPQQQVLGLTMLHSVLKCNAPDNVGLIYCDSVADCARPTCCTLACQDLKEDACVGGFLPSIRFASDTCSH